MISLILFSTAGCHLCELAEEQLRQARTNFAVTWRCVDIAEFPELMERYALRIPVVKEPHSEVEIGWPFTQADLREWLSQFPQ